MFPSENLHKKSIGELVRANFGLAGILHNFGISFFQHEQNSLEEVCSNHKVNPAQVISALENWAKNIEPTTEELYLHPVEVLVGYLKKKHRYFIRQELPFLSSMVEGILAGPKYEGLLADLRLMFPLFVDDFIHHIHEEEDTLFKRIADFQKIDKNGIPLADAVQIFELPAIKNMAMEHEDHDDEMEGIRKLTSDYYLIEAAPMAMKILYYELQKLENELIIHAKIENDLLFPKAVELEKEVKRKLLSLIKLN
ncbi:MAG: hemerythrin domain-containing protein [Cyclobacteriaceae bacterium]